MSFIWAHALLNTHTHTHTKSLSLNDMQTNKHFWWINGLYAKFLALNKFIG